MALMILAGKWYDYGKAVAQGEELSPRLGDPGLLAFGKKETGGGQTPRNAHFTGFSSISTL